MVYLLVMQADQGQSDSS